MNRTNSNHLILTFFVCIAAAIYAAIEKPKKPPGYYRRSSSVEELPIVAPVDSLNAPVGVSTSYKAKVKKVKKKEGDYSKSKTSPYQEEKAAKTLYNSGCGSHNGNTLYRGSRGGCYYFGPSGKKVYVDRSECKC